MRPNRAARRAGSIAALLAALACALPAWGQDEGDAEKPPQTRAEKIWATRKGAIPDEELERIDVERQLRRGNEDQRVRERVGRYLQAAAEITEEEGPAAARELLSRLDIGRMNEQEKARVYRLLAFIAYSDGDPKGAIDAFEKALDQEILPIDDETRIRFNIAQLWGGLQDWDETIAAINEWQRWAREPNPMGYYLKAIAYFQKDDADRAIENAEAAIELVDEPKEAWLQLLAALYIGKADYASAKPVLEQLVLRFPKKIYWVQLSLVYGALENYERSLAVQQVAYAQGLLVEDKELRRLARSYLFADLPYPAAKVLDKGLRDGIIEKDVEAYTMLANSWIASREYDRALEPLEKAAKLSDDGNLYARLGQVYLQREDWGEAASHLELALDRGGLDNPGSVLLLLGIASYNEGQSGKARRYFVQARDHEKSRAAAEGWLTHLDNEAKSNAEAAGSSAGAAPAGDSDQVAQAP